MKRALSFVVILCLFLSACSRPWAQTSPQAVEARIFAMDTDMSFTVYGPQEALNALTRTVFDLDAKLSVTRADSLVNQLNRTGRVETHDEDLLGLARAAQEIGDATGGALDVTLYPIVKAWGFTTGEHRIPDAETTAALLEKVDYSAIAVSENAITLPDGAEVDFGALAKGYAGELCAHQLREAGVTSAILRLSGNIQALGTKPDGSPWRVGIQDPQGEAEDLLGILEVADRAVVTSGSYQRYFVEDGIIYHHIMDPATGAPARSGLTSVTIISPSGTWADGLSTALFVMGREKALDYWQAHRDFDCVLVTEDGDVWITPGLANTFTLSSKSYTLHIAENSFS